MLNVFELSGERYFCHPVFREAFKALEIMAKATVAASTSQKREKKKTLFFKIPLNIRASDIKSSMRYRQFYNSLLIQKHSLKFIYKHWTARPEWNSQQGRRPRQRERV